VIGRLREVRDATGAVVFGGIVVGTAVVVIGGLTYGGIEISNAISNSTAKSTGNAQVKRDTNSGANQEQASATFNQLYYSVEGYEYQIKQATVTGMDSTDLVALQQTCQLAVEQYNSDANTITMRPYIPAGDPDNISLTVCN